jgi:hypothetical protein
MEQITDEIKQLSNQINSVEQQLEKDYGEWTTREKNKHGSHEQLRKKEEQLRELLILKEREKQQQKEEQLRDKQQELLKQQTILLQRKQSLAGPAPVTPQQVLKNLLGFDIETSQVKFSRPSVTLNGIPTDEISYIVPLMKFVCREEPTQTLYNTLDDYLDWKEEKIGEPEKKIKFVTVVGTSGKGKTTFARRFIDGKALCYNQ